MVINHPLSTTHNFILILVESNMNARRVEGIRIERTADEILALKLATSEVHALNQSAAIVFELFDGQTS